MTIVAATVGTLLLARILGTAEFGRYALAAMTSALCIGLSDLGVTEALLRRASLSYCAGGIPDDVPRGAISWVVVRCPLFVLAFALIVSHEALSVATYAVAVVLVAATTGMSVVLVASANVTPIARNRTGQALLNPAAALAAAGLGGSGATCFAAGLLAQYGFFSLMFLQARHRRGLDALFAPRLLRVTASERRFGLAQFFTGQLSALTTSRSEVFFFGQANATPRGVYSAQQSVATRLTLAVDALFGAIPTALATTVGESKARFEAAAGRVLRLSTYLLTVISGPMVLIGAVVALPLFGPGFQEQRMVVLPLLFMSMLGTATQPLLAIYFALGRTRETLTSAVASVLLNLAASAALVPQHLVAGAVAANVVGNLALVLGLSAPLCRDRGFRVDVLRLMGLTAASAALGLVATLVVWHLSSGSTVLVAVGAFLVTLLACLALGALTASLRDEDLAWMPQGVRGRVARSLVRLARVQRRDSTL